MNESERLVDELVEAARARNRLPPTATVGEMIRATDRVMVARTNLVFHARRLDADPAHLDRYMRLLCGPAVGVGEREIARWFRECVAWLDSLERKEAA